MKGTCCIISYVLAVPLRFINIVELLYILMKGRLFCVFINEEYNGMVNCEEVITTTEYLTL